MEVEVIDGNMDRALLMLKKAVARDGTLQAIRLREISGHKQSYRRKIKAMRAERRRIKRMGNGGRMG